MNSREVKTRAPYEPNPKGAAPTFYHLAKGAPRLERLALLKRGVLPGRCGRAADIERNEPRDKSHFAAWPNGL